MDQFQKLEEKLSKIVETYKRAQAENRDLVQQMEKLKSDSKHGAEQHMALEREVESLRRERDDVRTRIERLLDQVEALTKQDSAG
ncbi:MAG: cell division protein ZapB [Terriglobia bacterium]